MLRQINHTYFLSLNSSVHSIALLSFYSSKSIFRGCAFTRCKVIQQEPVQLSNVINALLMSCHYVMRGWDILNFPDPRHRFSLPAVTVSNVGLYRNHSGEILFFFVCFCLRFQNMQSNTARALSNSHKYIMLFGHYVMLGYPELTSFPSHSRHRLY